MRIYFYLKTKLSENTQNSALINKVTKRLGDYHYITAFDTAQKTDEIIQLANMIKHQCLYFGGESSILTFETTNSRIYDIYKQYKILLLLSIASTKDVLDVMTDYNTNLSPLFCRTMHDKNITISYLIPIIAFEMKDPITTIRGKHYDSYPTAIKLYKHLQELQSQLNNFAIGDDWDYDDAPNGYLLSKKYRKIENFICSTLEGVYPAQEMNGPMNEETAMNFAQFIIKRGEFLEYLEEEEREDDIIVESNEESEEEEEK